MRILLVEDDPMIGKSLREALQDAGMSVDWARSGEDGEVALSVGAYAVVLLDIGLPGLDGFEIAERIRAQPRHRNVRLVAITGYGQDADRARTREAGFADHLVKPVDFTELNRVLASMH